MVTGTEVFVAPEPDPWWGPTVPGLARTRDLPPGWVDGWTFATPVVDTRTYLAWLAGRVDRLGGTITRLNLSALPTGCGLVVNCAGLVRSQARVFQPRHPVYFPEAAPSLRHSISV
jgi:D-amino-acid oxidase